jgi:hypothetical protein
MADSYENANKLLSSIQCTELLNLVRRTRYFQVDSSQFWTCDTCIVSKINARIRPGKVYK